MYLYKPGGKEEEEEEEGARLSVDGAFCFAQPRI